MLDAIMAGLVPGMTNYRDINLGRFGGPWRTTEPCQNGSGRRLFGVVVLVEVLAGYLLLSDVGEFQQYVMTEVVAEDVPA